MQGYLPATVYKAVSRLQDARLLGFRRQALGYATCLGWGWVQGAIAHVHNTVGGLGCLGAVGGHQQGEPFLLLQLPQ